MLRSLQPRLQVGELLLVRLAILQGRILIQLVTERSVLLLRREDLVEGQEGECGENRGEQAALFLLAFRAKKTQLLNTLKINREWGKLKTY